MRTAASGRIRVLHVITRLIVGGAQENTLLTVAGLDRARYDVTLASGPTLGREGSLEARIAADASFVRVPELLRDPHPANDAVAVARLYALMRRGRYQIVHTHTTKAGLLGRIAARWARVPVVIHTPHGHAFHDYLSRAGSGALIRVERVMARWTHRIVCLTDAERDDHLRYRIGPPRKFEVIHSGVDLERFGTPRIPPEATRRSLGLEGAGPLVGCVARLVPVKGVDCLLDAWPAVRAAVPGAMVVFVGDGPLRSSLEAAAAARGIRDAVVFLGVRDDVAELLPMFDLVVLPSRNEGMGRAAVEALAAGRPVVGSRISGLQDVVRDGETGLLVPPGDVPALGRAIVRCLTERPLRERMSAHAKASAEPYGIAAMLAQLDQLYTHTVAAAR